MNIYDDIRVFQNILLVCKMPSDRIQSKSSQVSIGMNCDLLVWITETLVQR